MASSDDRFASGHPRVAECNEPEAGVFTVEEPLTGKSELIREDTQQGEVTLAPTVQQRRFSIDWDPKQ